MKQLRQRTDLIKPQVLAFLLREYWDNFFVERFLEKIKGFDYCYICNEVKPLRMFHHAPSKIKGRESECKKCRNKRRAEYHIRNREKDNQRTWEWRQKHPNYHIEYGRKLRAI